MSPQNLAYSGFLPTRDEVRGWNHSHYCKMSIQKDVVSASRLRFYSGSSCKQNQVRPTAFRLGFGNAKARERKGASTLAVAVHIHSSQFCTFAILPSWLNLPLLAAWSASNLKMENATRACRERGCEHRFEASMEGPDRQSTSSTRQTSRHKACLCDRKMEDRFWFDQNRSLKATWA